MKMFKVRKVGSLLLAVRCSQQQIVLICNLAQNASLLELEEGTALCILYAR